MTRLLLVMLFSITMVIVALTLGGPMGAPTAGDRRLFRVAYEGGTIQPGGDTVGRAPGVTRAPSGVRAGRPYIVIDRYCNRLFLRTADSVLLDALCSTGSGGELVDTLTGRHWKFDTPAGVHSVTTKLTNPWWRKPDWAFIEEGLPLPQRETERLDDQMMGDYAIGFGDGYFIHGTIYERMLGTAVTHGCVRLAAADLKILYDKTSIGTLVYVY